MDTLQQIAEDRMAVIKRLILQLRHESQMRADDYELCDLLDDAALMLEWLIGQ